MKADLLFNDVILFFLPHATGIGAKCNRNPTRMQPGFPSNPTGILSGIYFLWGRIRTK
ncbi:MAG: hypothetical protein LUH22_03260 [Bacteroides sp.]|nr:hypothetical protein [Bacteroides sp.]